MREIVATTQFRRDTKRIRKQGRDLDELRAVARRLAVGETLEDRYRDHRLKGEWSAYRECHVRSDWLLIYRRTGRTHPGGGGDLPRATRACGVGRVALGRGGVGMSGRSPVALHPRRTPRLAQLVALQLRLTPLDRVEQP